jgi:hypothetical protein
VCVEARRCKHAILRLSRLRPDDNLINSLLYILRKGALSAFMRSQTAPSLCVWIHIAQYTHNPLFVSCKRLWVFLVQPIPSASSFSSIVTGRRVPLTFIYFYIMHYAPYRMNVNYIINARAFTPHRHHTRCDASGDNRSLALIKRIKSSYRNVKHLHFIEGRWL